MHSAGHLQGDALPSSRCDTSTPASLQVVRSLFFFIGNITRDPDRAPTSPEGTIVVSGGVEFHRNETHYSAWVNGTSICSVALQDLRRIEAVSSEPIRDPLYVVVPITCVYALIFLFGIVGNVSTCVVIARNRHMHTATNYYLFSLAVSDLLLLVSGLPPEICHIWSRYPYLFGEVFCVLQGFAAETSANATVLTITAFTMERYFAICRPFQARAMSALPRAVRFVLLAWLLGLALAVPPATQFGVVTRVDPLGRDMSECTVKRVTVQHAFLLSTGLFFVLPLAVISVLYVLIGLRLRRSRRVLAARRHSAGSMGSIRANSTHSQARVIRMLVAVVVAFFICWAPFHAQRLLAVYASRSSQNHPATVALYSALTYLSGVLYYLSTTVNPVLYHIMSNKFREAFKSTLRTECGWWSRQPRAGRSDGSLRRSYAALSRSRAHNVESGDSGMLPPPADIAPEASVAPSEGLPPPPHSPSCLTATLDVRRNTYSTANDTRKRRRRSDFSGEDDDESPRDSGDSGNATEGSEGAHGPGPGLTFGLPGPPASEHGSQGNIVLPGALKGTRKALLQRLQDKNGSANRNQHATPNGLSVPTSDTGVKPRKRHQETSVSPSPSRTSRSPIEALARKLRSLPARSVLSKRWPTSWGSQPNPQAPRKAPHSAISNSSLQDWDKDEMTGEELAKYMGEVNQRARQ